MTDPEQMSLLNERGTSVLKDEKSYWRKWIIQLEILIYKNLKMAWNNLIFSITGVIIPALLFFLFYINVTSNNLPFNGEIEFGPFKAQKFDDLTCFPKDRKNQTIPGAPCIPILYTVNSTASLLDATLLMNQLAEQANLDKGIAMGFNDSNAMLDFVSNHTGSFGVAFIFQKIDFMQSQLSYSLAINSSMQESINAAKLKVDQAFANLVIQANNLSIGPVDVSFSREEIPWIPQYWLEKYPDGWFQYKDDSSGARGHLIVSIFAGALPFLLGCALFSSVILSLASKEKHDRVFSLMKVMGLFDSTYWISWIVLILIIATVSSYGSFLIGYFSKEILFKNINFVLFTLIGTVSFTSIASSALCFSAILKQPRWVNFFIFLVFTSTVGIGSFLATFFQGTTFSLMAYDSDICPPYALNLASLFPIFHYAKLFSSIMKGTQNYIDPELKIPVQKYYGFNEFTSEIYITCKDPDCPVAISDLTSVIYLALLTCMHFFLSWYFSQAFSSEDGSSSLSFLFFLKPSYWGFKINGTDSAIVDKDDRILQEQVTSAQEQSIRMFKVSKAYKDISAVKELTLQMNKNEIFVLLGHNGAGKSTTINMITGQTDPTFGEAFIFGYNLKESKSLIQQNIGLCPQDNVLWPELSTEDHLYIYGRLRGLDKKTLKSEIPFVLKKYSLHSVSKKMISTFSGGMKRRVSMSLAVIGSPKLIILDEPTTGLDPLLRHKVWDNIRELKRESLVLLTTHNMEEADALGDNIAIMSGGKLRACGSSLFLKNRFGSGYQIQLVSSLEYVEKIRGTVVRLLPQAKIVSEDSGNVTLSLPRSSLVAFPNFYRWLEEQGVDSSVKSWSFSNSTLEEVFLKIANSEKSVNEQIELLSSNQIKSKCVICNSKEAEDVVLYTKTGIEVTVANVVCFSCATGVSKIEESKDEDLVIDWNLKENNSAVKKSGVSKINEHTEIHVPTKIAEIPKYTKGSDVYLSQFTAILYKNFRLLITGRKAFLFQILLIIILAVVFWKIGGPTGGKTNNSPRKLCPNGSINNGGCFVDIYAVTWSPADDFLFSDFCSESRPYTAAVFDGFKFIELGVQKCSHRIQIVNSSSEVYFESLNSSYSRLLSDRVFPVNSKQLSSCVTSWYASNLKYYNIFNALLLNKDFKSEYPAVIVEIENASFGVRSSSLKYKLWYVSSETFDSFYTLNLPVFQNRTSEGYNYCSNLYNSYLYNSYDLYVNDQLSLITHVSHPLSNNLLKSISNDQNAAINISLFGFDDLEFPEEPPLDTSIDTTTLSYCVLFLLLITFPLSDSVYRIAFETEKDLFYFQRLYGVEIWLYWIGQYTFDLCVILFWGFIFMIFNSFFNSSYFAQTNKSIMILAIFLGAHATSCTIVFCSAVFKKANQGRYFSLFLVIASSVAAPILETVAVSRVVTILVSFIPVISFGRAFTVATTWSLLSTSSRDITETSLLMFFGGTVFAIIGVAIHTILYDSISSLIPSCLQKKNMSHEIPRISKDMNDDVLNEKQLAESDLERALKLIGLYKGFVSKDSDDYFYAVNDLYLTIKDAECFGLLGPNGAGKSTIINMLSGFLKPTSGKILVNGSDISANKSEIRSNMGVCPQFDVVWPDLSVKDHIYFFAKVKGVVKKSLNGRVQKIAEQLSLDGDCFNKASDTLSGGMRRRLSIAISLVGGPRIWVLDEPTTGLSPDLKRQLWNVITEEKKNGRAIILCTHSMEEAETLCSRIGIVAGGRLKVIGTTNFLKEKYGDGFKLSFITDDPLNEKSVDRLLKNVQASICATAELGGFIGSSIHFILPKHSMDTNRVLRIFELMESRTHDFRKVNHILEWGIAQTTMEEVFINTVQESKS